MGGFFLHRLGSWPLFHYNDHLALVVAPSRKSMSANGPAPGQDATGIQGEADRPTSHQQPAALVGRRTLPLPLPGEAAPARAAALAAIPRPDRSPKDATHQDEEAGRPTQPLMGLLEPGLARPGVLRADLPPTPVRAAVSNERTRKRTQVGLAPPPPPREGHVGEERARRGPPPLPAAIQPTRPEHKEPPPLPDTSRHAVLPPEAGEPPQLVAADGPRPPLPSHEVATARNSQPPAARTRAAERAPARRTETRRRRGRNAYAALGAVTCCMVLALTVGVVLWLGDRDGLAFDWRSSAPETHRDPEARPTTARKRVDQRTPDPHPAKRNPAPPASAATAAKTRTPTPLPSVNGIPWLAPAVTTAPSCKSLVGVEGQDLQPYLLQQALERGQAEFMRGNLEKAQMAFCEARFLGDTSPTVMWSLTQVLLLRGDPKQALEVVDQMLEQRPGDSRSRELRGDVLIRLGQVEAAKQAWVSAAGAPHASDLVIGNLLRVNRTDAQSALAGGDVLRADRMLRRVVALDPQDPAAAAELASVLAKMGKKRAARQWLAYAVSLDGSHPRVEALRKTL
jgi:tetratricopeptide (TPR) repeat protein